MLCIYFTNIRCPFRTWPYLAIGQYDLFSIKWEHIKTYRFSFHSIDNIVNITCLHLTILSFLEFYSLMAYQP